MDTNDALKLSKEYVKKIKQNRFDVLDAWLFGSYAKGNYHDGSDVDIALVLPENSISIDTDVRLMSLRKGEETMIEVHTYSPGEFAANMPVVIQIRQHGYRL
jgi:predicted nucleotidyltransferase